MTSQSEERILHHQKKRNLTQKRKKLIEITRKKKVTKKTQYRQKAATMRMTIVKY